MIPNKVITKEEQKIWEKFGGRSSESTSLPHALFYWNMSKYTSNMRNRGVGATNHQNGI